MKSDLSPISELILDCCELQEVLEGVVLPKEAVKTMKKIGRRLNKINREFEKAGNEPPVYIIRGE